MSYNKNIGNYKVRFKDELSYFEAKLENLKLYPDIPFIGFIQNEMYDKNKCEVEGVGPFVIDFLADAIASAERIRIINGWNQEENVELKVKEPEDSEDPVDNRFDILDL